MNDLQRILYEHERIVLAESHRLRELATNGDGDTSRELTNIAQSLRLTSELVGCLRRLTQDRTGREIHLAFGAPGDFGYHTALGIELARLYHQEGAQ